MARLKVETRRFIRFCFVGASGVAVNLAVFWAVSKALGGGGLLENDDRRFLASNAAGFVVSVATNFLLNDAWTWRDRRAAESRSVARFARFALVASVAGAVQLSVAYLARALLPDLLLTVSLSHHAETAAVLAGIGVATVINFLLNNVWTFRRSASPALIAGAASDSGQGADARYPADAPPGDESHGS